MIKEQVPITTFINNRVKLLQKNHGPIRKIAEVTGIQPTKLWRMVNNLSPIDLKSLKLLEEHNYIDIDEYIKNHSLRRRKNITKTIELLRTANSLRMDLEHPEPHEDIPINDLINLLTDVEEFLNKL